MLIQLPFAHFHPVAAQLQFSLVRYTEPEFDLHSWRFSFRDAVSQNRVAMRPAELFVAKGALVLTPLSIAPDTGLAAEDLSWEHALLFFATSLACNASGRLVLLAGRGSSARR